MSLILITGGVRAGKSRFAEALALAQGGERDVCFAATAEAKDQEMAARIAAHRARRPTGWATVEAPRRVAARLVEVGPARVVLVDCLTMLVSNVLLAQPEPAEWNVAWREVESEIDGLLELTAGAVHSTILVTNEVGLGIIPMSRLSRLYLDLLGSANQKVAATANTVYLVVSGIPVVIKPAP
jgi:adenosylcobinamide kinase / adenosylcobinamide-phosphate guanylyltransferase